MWRLKRLLFHPVTVLFCITPNDIIIFIQQYAMLFVHILLLNGRRHCREPRVNCSYPVTIVPPDTIKNCVSKIVRVDVVLLIQKSKNSFSKDDAVASENHSLTVAASLISYSNSIFFNSCSVHCYRHSYHSNCPPKSASHKLPPRL